MACVISRVFADCVFDRLPGSLSMDLRAVTFNPVQNVEINSLKDTTV